MDIICVSVKSNGLSLSSFYKRSNGGYSPGECQIVSNSNLEAGGKGNGTLDGLHLSCCVF